MGGAEAHTETKTKTFEQQSQPDKSTKWTNRGLWNGSVSVCMCVFVTKDLGMSAELFKENEDDRMVSQRVP